MLLFAASKSGSEMFEYNPFMSLKPSLGKVNPFVNISHKVSIIDQPVVFNKLN